MNAAMRAAAKDPAQLDVFRPLIYYVVMAVEKLPPQQSVVYRGISVPVDAAAYGPGMVVAWPAFSSTSSDAEVGAGLVLPPPPAECHRGYT